MDPRLSRIVGTVLLLLGITVVLWRALGSPRDWEGDMRLLRSALMLGALGVIGLSARLIFPGTRSEAPDDTSEKADS
ncbi:hypothetical protein [Streptomyces sp. DSM 15324]|uniref:hypothetical protein n=1 Tax=Streptomyces sp. DSM 15324 TaxID=1739111 RepID=UPI001F33D9AD|nr:hypothetical protein [Streptomyces sp. DSM 15324]